MKANVMNKLSPLIAHYCQNIATECALAGVAINVWGVADFEGSCTGIADLLPLCQKSGGKVLA
jgi:hypothetical protein